MIKNISSKFIFLTIAFALSGCASSPVREASYGKPQALMDLVEAGQLDPNERLEYDSSASITPLCALLRHRITASAVDKLLTQGADVNKPCWNIGTGMPLDSVIDRASLVGSLSSPYSTVNSYRPEFVPTFVEYARKLIARGGRSETGSMTMNEVNLKILTQIEQSNAFHPELVKSYQATVDSTRSFLRGIGTVAGVVVAANVLSNSSASLSSSGAASRIASSTQNAASSSSFKTTQPSRSAINLPAVTSASTVGSGQSLPQTADANISEPRPDFGGRTWSAVGGAGKLASTRASACQQAIDDREEQIAIETRSKRFRGVERRSDCSCSYTARTKSWLCQVWYLPVGHSASSPGNR